MKYLLTLAICFSSIALFAQQKPNQYILIIRSKADVKASAEAIRTNIKHWQDYMGDLGKNGKIAGGYRPASDGATITAKATKSTPYVTGGDVVSSFLVINAADMAEAKLIASKCPALELGGSVEIRSVQNTAN